MVHYRSVKVTRHATASLINNCGTCAQKEQTQNKNEN